MERRGFLKWMSAAPVVAVAGDSLALAPEPDRSAELLAEIERLKAELADAQPEPQATTMVSEYYSDLYATASASPYYAVSIE